MLLEETEKLLALLLTPGVNLIYLNCSSGAFDDRLCQDRNTGNNNPVLNREQIV
jgi:hypothetical protein